MKLFIFFIIFSSTFFCTAQDIISTKSNKEIKAIVLDTTTENIIYQDFYNRSAKAQRILKTDVQSIFFSKTDNNDLALENTSDPKNSFQYSPLYLQGEVDATKNYHQYKDAGNATLLVSLVSPILGLIPAIACSGNTPSEATLNVIDKESFKKPDYYKGYTKKAKHIKQSKVWKNWCLGLGSNAAAVFLYYGLLNK